MWVWVSFLTATSAWPWQWCVAGLRCSWEWLGLQGEWRDWMSSIRTVRASVDLHRGFQMWVREMRKGKHSLACLVKSKNFLLALLQHLVCLTVATIYHWVPGFSEETEREFPKHCFIHTSLQKATFGLILTLPKSLYFQPPYVRVRTFQKFTL